MTSNIGSPRRRISGQVAAAIAATALALLVADTPRAHAQAAGPPADSEEVEPRRIGTAGAMTVGVSGYVDRFASSRDNFPVNYTAQIDVSRFLLDRVALRGGLAGSGSLGGDDPEERPVGAGAPSLHLFVGSLYYFTPRSMLSVYAGADYWAQLTQRSSPDAGTVLGTVGLEGAVSSRARLYLEGGYGIALTRGEDDEARSRLAGRVGVRLTF